MNNMTVSQDNQATMSSKDIAALVGKQHKNVMADIQAMFDQLEIQSAEFSADYIDGRGRKQPCFKLNRYYTEVLVTGYDVKRRAAVIDRWYELESGSAQPIAQQPQPALHESAIEFAKMAMGALPNLGESSRQQLLSEASQLAYGMRLIPLPKVEENLLTATQVGEKLGITANKVGRIAKAHNLKTDEFGEWRLDKSRSSSKQVESFCYKPSVIDAIQAIIKAA